MKLNVKLFKKDYTYINWNDDTIFIVKRTDKTIWYKVIYSNALIDNNKVYKARLYHDKTGGFDSETIVEYFNYKTYFTKEELWSDGAEEKLIVYY